MSYSCSRCLIITKKVAGCHPLLPLFSTIYLNLLECLSFHLLHAPFSFNTPPPAPPFSQPYATFPTRLPRRVSTPLASVTLTLDDLKTLRDPIPTYTIAGPGLLTITLYNKPPNYLSIPLQPFIFLFAGSFNNPIEKLLLSQLEISQDDVPIFGLFLAPRRLSLLLPPGARPGLRNPTPTRIYRLCTPIPDPSPKSEPRTRADIVPYHHALPHASPISARHRPSPLRRIFQQSN